MADPTRPLLPTPPSRGLRAVAAWTGALALVMALQGEAATASESAIAPSEASVVTPATQSRLVDFSAEPVSAEARGVAYWALHSGDSAGMPYMIVDKVDARVFVFDRQGRLQGAGPALLGMERGDGTAKGIGSRQLSAIAPRERTTPAGRFVASLAHDLKGQEILWIDYDTALAMHRVAKGTPVERRAERLQSATAADNRISYGCINVPAAFYERVVSPAFTHSSGIVYILPETRPAHEVFGSYDIDGSEPSSGDAPR